jgi:acyl carrier protein
MEEGLELLRAGQIDKADPVIWGKIQAAFADALGLENEEVSLEHTVIGDLEAESLDFLDIAYKLEVSFDIKIPRGGIESAAREGLDDESYEVNGILTSTALERLTLAMPEVPAESFSAGLRVTEVPELFVVATFYNLVVGLLGEKSSAA